jgi:deoxyribodipyrimidine photo-lyase
VEFIRESLVSLDQELRRLASREAAGLIVRHALAVREIPRLARELGVQAVFANHDDEPLAIARDDAVRTALARDGIALHGFKDHAIFERTELRTGAGTPYTVYTPYRKAWLAKLTLADLEAYPVAEHAAALAPRPQGADQAVPALAVLGFESGTLAPLGIACGSRGGVRLFEEFAGRLARYDRDRDFPALDGTSRLSVHLRFGTISIREVAAQAHALAQAGSGGAATWLDELIWRDFYLQILANFPHVAGPEHQGGNFRPAYDAIEWEQGPAADLLFRAWCQGRTGYPLVDAAMAQINQTGYMHNRLRMVVASFLVKDLGIDWRRGERYFAAHLIDYDLAANNGGWQWAASTGCDAQPYFRIFNPVSQSRKFDPQGRFILRYLPQLAGLPLPALHAPWTATPAELAAAGIELGKTYPAPIVQHEQARQQTLRRYAAARAGA